MHWCQGFSIFWKMSYLNRVTIQEHNSLKCLSYHNIPLSLICKLDFMKVFCIVETVYYIFLKWILL